MHILFAWKLAHCGSYEHVHYIPPPFPRTNSAVWKKSLLGLVLPMFVHLSFGFAKPYWIHLWTKTHTSSYHSGIFLSESLHKLGWFSIFSHYYRIPTHFFPSLTPDLHAEDHFVRCSIFHSKWKTPMSSRMLHPSMICSHDLFSTVMNPFTVNRLSEWHVTNICLSTKLAFVFHISWTWT